MTLCHKNKIVAKLTSFLHHVHSFQILSVLSTTNLAFIPVTDLSQQSNFAAGKYFPEKLAVSPSVTGKILIGLVCISFNMWRSETKGFSLWRLTSAGSRLSSLIVGVYCVRCSLFCRIVTLPNCNPLQSAAARASAFSFFFLAASDCFSSASICLSNSCIMITQ